MQSSAMRRKVLARIVPPTPPVPATRERDFFIDNLLVRIHFIIVMIRWTGLAPWGFEFPFPAVVGGMRTRSEVGELEALGL